MENGKGESQRLFPLELNCGNNFKEKLAAPEIKYNIIDLN